MGLSPSEVTEHRPNLHCRVQKTDLIYFKFATRSVSGTDEVTPAAVDAVERRKLYKYIQKYAVRFFERGDCTVIVLFVVISYNIYIS